ncbi:alanine:cation symporter family protein, partial [candidate division KSB1 bacterium]|nr:alanine:cation symporter family protein [candidate division KSB1 bacterium]
MENVIQLISDAAGNFWAVLWWVGPIPIPGPISLLLGTGFLLTFATKGIQFSKLGLGLKLMLKGAMRKDESEKEKGDISPFQALMTALAATVGNGNIAGVATAIASGGPGALFWMWVTAVVGMATKYSEAVLAIHFRKTAADGSMSGGPMHYIRQGFEKIPLLKPIAIPFAGAFALFGAWTALFGTGNMMQTNQMALAFNEQMGVPFWVTGGVIAILTGLVIIGGIKRIGKTAEILVPGMIVIYMLSAMFILIMNIDRVPGMLQLIVASAFTGEAVAGGLIGHSVRMAL